MFAPDGTRVMPLIIAGLTLGVGLGGFVDGIVLHQILQWHHMLTAHDHYDEATVHALEVNMLWDGLFHSATWVFTALGVGYLWRAGRMEGVRWSGTSFVGAMLAGWGGFNLVEGVVNHHLLQIHHVRDDLGGPLSWDLGFLAFGAVLLAVGVGLIRAGTREDERASAG